MTADVDYSSLSIEGLKKLVGLEVGVSSWHTLDQSAIDAFADVTGDHQFIHVDPVLAGDTAFGGTIAHGFLTLSMLSVMGQEAQPRIEGSTFAINYGFDRVRFLSPVRAGARVRGRFVLSVLNLPKATEVDVTWRATVEVEGARRPALVADWLNRFYLAEDLGSVEN
ncbi:MaoC family dehydratase [Roseibium aggregatum]|uniref:MaoC family dehydratase n=1 Tax=Roseibium aggregatum TaxID=187304 RepID=A0A939J5W6_9HYPH|nr:MaoC/PaaZ C-terminal domain-containing protein [Roseibium aggregatum]MBN9672675.1 MaoC family dehydratase [Roseibium aggregatum]